MSVTFTFIRHAESMDNLKAVWAGWRNATLSNHGMHQATALAISLASIPFTAILTSDLQRARLTAEQIVASQPRPIPLITQSKSLREQNFGQGEGKPFVKVDSTLPSLRAHYAQGKFPMLYDRKQSYPLGESLFDVEKRAEEAWKVLLKPYVDQAAKNGNDTHIAVVSHGIFIPELIAVIVNMGQCVKRNPRDFSHMKNTAWTRIVIRPTEAAPNVLESSRLSVKVVCINNYAHLDKLKRSKVTGSTAFDPKQGDIRSFFGGGGGKVKKEQDNKVTRKERTRPY